MMQQTVTKRTPPPRPVHEAHWQLVADSFDELRKEIGQDAEKWEKVASLLHEACFGTERAYEQIEFDLKQVIEAGSHGSSSTVPTSSD
jgi:hypothetical protein